MNSKRGSIIVLIILVVVYLILFFIMPEQLGVWTRRFIRWITFGLI